MNRIAARRPTPEEIDSQYHRDLVAQVDGDDVLKILDDQLYWICELASHVSAVQVDVVHKPHAWTIRQVFEHCATTERILGTRAARIAAGDTTPLPPFDENAYADARYGLGNFSLLTTELAHLRQANVLLLRRIGPRCWDHRAIANEVRVSVRGIAWILAAHLHHHFEIVESRIGMTVSRQPPTPTGSDA